MSIKYKYVYAYMTLRHIGGVMDDVRLARVHQLLDFASVPKRGRNVKVAEKTGYTTSMVARILSGNAPMTERFLLSVCSAYSFSRNYIETGVLPWDAPRTVASVDQADSDENNVFLELVVVKEALKELKLMPEPKRWEAVGVLKRMNSGEPEKQ